MTDKKTAVQQLIDMLIDTKETKCNHLHEIIFFDGVLALIEAGEFLEIEKSQIIKAYENGVSDFADYDPERHGNESPNGVKYFKNIKN